MYNNKTTNNSIKNIVIILILIIPIIYNIDIAKAQIIEDATVVEAEAATVPDTNKGVSFYNNYTLDPSMINYKIATVGHNEEGIIEYIRPTSSKTLLEDRSLKESSVVINMDYASNWIAKPGETPSSNKFNNINTIFFINKYCSISTKRYYTFVLIPRSEQSNGSIVCNDIGSQYKGLKLNLLKEGDKYIVVGSSTLIVNNNISISSESYYNFYKNYIEMSNIYSDSKLEITPSHNYFSASNSPAERIVDNWMIKKGTQGLILIKDNRTIYFADNTKKIEKGNTQYNQPKELPSSNSTINKDSQNTTPTNANNSENIKDTNLESISVDPSTTTAFSKVINYAKSFFNKDSKGTEIPIDSPAQTNTSSMDTTISDNQTATDTLISSERPPLTTMQLILSVLMFWK